MNWINDVFDYEELNGGDWLEYLADEFYANHEIIPVDSYSYRDYKAGRSDVLEIRVQGAWFHYKPPPVKDYDKYSHTYSPAGCSGISLESDD